MSSRTLSLDLRAAWPMVATMSQSARCDALSPATRLHEKKSAHALISGIQETRGIS